MRLGDDHMTQQKKLKKAIRAGPRRPAKAIPPPAARSCWRARNLKKLPRLLLPMKIPAYIRASFAAGFADEPMLDVG